MSSNILLINPSVSEKSQSQKINAIVNITFPTSLGVLAGYVGASGVRTRIVDEQIHPIADKDLPDLIEGMNTPRLVGISVLTLNCGRAYDLSSKIKEIDPETKVIFGGIHPTVVPEEALSKNGVDIVVRGEGEETLKELVSSIAESRPFENIMGISYLSNGKVIHSPDRPMIEDLDAIPPFPYHLFENDLDMYPNFSGIFGSRGCPYNCIFCSSRSISGKRYRYHSVQRILKEMKILVGRYGQESIFLMDDNIAVNKKHFKAICDGIINEKLHKAAFFHGSLRGDNADDEVLEMAYAANFRILYYGLETGSERLMKIIDKGETVGAVKDAINRSAERGFSVGTTIIFGLPSETRAERYETMKLAYSLPLSSLRFNTLTPYPGTPVYQDESMKGNVLVKNNWENFGVQYMWESDDIPYVPEGTDRLELIFDTMWANVSYYLRPRGIKKLFTERYAGGNVIKLSDKWYLSFSELNKMTRLFAVLSFRFMDVSVRLGWTKLKSYLKGCH